MGDPIEVLLVLWDPFCPLESYGVIFNPLGSYGVPLVLWGPMRSLLSFGVLWVPLGSYGALWAATIKYSIQGGGQKRNFSRRRRNLQPDLGLG